MLAALVLAMSLPTTTASAATDRRICALGLSVFGTGVELLCSEPKGPDVIDTSCQVFEPMRWSRNDTPATRAQAKQHNRAWESLCGENK